MAVKLFLFLTKKNYWEAEWDYEARKTGHEMTKQGCIRSPLTNLDNQKHVINMLRLDNTDFLLDVGCAAGPLLKAVSSTVQFATGIDIANEMVRIAKINLSGISNVEVKHSAITEMPFENNTFSKICCFGMFQYLDRSSVKKAFQELFRVAKPDALLFIGELPKAGVKRRHFDFKVFLFKEEEIISACKEEGFTIERFDNSDTSFDLLLRKP